MKNLHNIIKNAQSVVNDYKELNKIDNLNIEGSEEDGNIYN